MEPDSKRISRALTDLWKLHLQYVYLGGEDGWSKCAGEAAKNMELLAKIDLFVSECLKAKLGKSIQQIEMLLAKLNPIPFFDLKL